MQNLYTWRESNHKAMYYVIRDDSTRAVYKINEILAIIRKLNVR